MIHYTIGFQQANNHLFDISIVIDFKLQKGQRFCLPNWLPGSYMIRDFCRNLTPLKASCKGVAVNLSKLDKATWKLEQAVDELLIEYQVYAWDLSVRSAHLDNQHGFFNGSSLFLSVCGQENMAHHLTLQASKHATDNQWEVATAMSPVSIDAQGFGEYKSENYLELIDHPFEFGRLQFVEFEVFGVPHKMVFTEAPARVDWQRIANDIKQICETQVKFFADEKPPFQHYVFMTFVYPKAFGGLEHRASTALHCNPECLPLTGENMQLISTEYMEYLLLCSHEYFHNWNVKRIKPQSFINPNLAEEVYTEQLWFFEGITVYYEKLLLARSGVIQPTDFLQIIAQLITRVMRGDGRLLQSVTQSSFDAWTKFYKQDENALNAIVSYYTKGALVGLCLDYEIRRLTNQQKSLDDLMRHLWQQFGKKNIGVQEKQIQQLTEVITEQPMQAFFEQTLYAVEDLDLQSVFDSLDIDYQLIPQYLSKEKGGYSEQPKERKPVAFLGATHTDDALGAKIYSVEKDSCAATAGLSNKDIIIAIDQQRITSSNLDETVAKIPVGETVNVSYFRRDRLYHAYCELTASKNNTCYLSFKNAKPSDSFMRWAFNSSSNSN